MGEDCLVLFYSWSGNTRRVAQMIAQQTHGDLLELRPRHPYPEEYSMTVKRARGEIQKKNYPELCPLELDVANYKTLFVGTPNWCGTVAPPVVSFLKEFMPTEKISFHFAPMAAAEAEILPSALPITALGAMSFLCWRCGMTAERMQRRQ